jgi:hypothetical protein
MDESSLSIASLTFGSSSGNCKDGESRRRRRRSVHLRNIFFFFLSLVEVGLGAVRNCPTSSNKSKEGTTLGKIQKATQSVRSTYISWARKIFS